MGWVLVGAVAAQEWVVEVDTKAQRFSESVAAEVAVDRLLEQKDDRVIVTDQIVVDCDEKEPDFLGGVDWFTRCVATAPSVDPEVFYQAGLAEQVALGDARRGTGSTARSTLVASQQIEGIRVEGSEIELSAAGELTTSGLVDLASLQAEKGCKSAKVAGVEAKRGRASVEVVAQELLLAQTEEGVYRYAWAVDLWDDEAQLPDFAWVPDCGAAPTGADWALPTPP